MGGDPTGAAQEEAGSDADEAANRPCPRCGLQFKSTQGFAGHLRLAHSASTRAELESRDAELRRREVSAKARDTEASGRSEAARRREVAVAQREQQIADTGPAALGLSQCAECRAWFDSSDDRRRHARSVHPIEEAVAQEVGRGRDRVERVWREAAEKQEAHPDKSTDWVVGQFWSGTDQRILKALLARNASFRFAKTEE